MHGRHLGRARLQVCQSLLQHERFAPELNAGQNAGVVNGWVAKAPDDKGGRHAKEEGPGGAHPV